MRTVVILVVTLLLAACGKSPLELSLEDTMAKVRADCLTKGGDELLPYGATAWTALFINHAPASYRCVRFERDRKQTLAVYVLRSNGSEVTYEVR